MPCTLGLYEKSMPGSLSWDEKLSAAKAAGFDALEISIDETDEKLARLVWSREERLSLLKISREKNIMLNTICLSGHRKYPLGSSVKATEQRGMEIMEKAILFASDMGVRIIQLAGYDVYYGEQSSPDTRKRFVENIERSTLLAASKGVILAFETMENDFCNTIEKAMDFVNIVDSPYCKVYPDTGNISNATGDVAGDIRKGAGHIVAAHLKETVPGKFRDLKFGEGRVDFKLVTDELKAQGVRLYTAEFWYDGGSGWREELTRVNNFLRPYLAE